MKRNKDIFVHREDENIIISIDRFINSLLVFVCGVVFGLLLTQHKPIFQSEFKFQNGRDVTEKDHSL